MRRHRRRLCLTLLIVISLGLGAIADSTLAQGKYKESPALAEHSRAHSRQDSYFTP